MKLLILISLFLCSSTSFSQFDNKAENRELVSAFYKGDKFNIERLLDLGASIDTVDNYNFNRNGLIISINKFSSWPASLYELVNFLIKKKIDVNWRDTSGLSVLDHALWQVAHHSELITLLVNSGAKVEKSSLFTAVHRPWVESKVFKLLIKEGAELNFQNNSGYGVLHVIETMSAGPYTVEYIKVLVEAGIDLNLRNKNGETALLRNTYRATSEPYLEFVKLFIKHGADVNIPDNDGITPLSIAKSQGNSELVRILLEAGAQSK